LLPGVAIAATAALTYLVQKHIRYNTPKKDDKGCVVELSAAQWDAFWRDGFIKIGRTLSDEEIKQLCQRVDDIMMGKVKYEKLLMQIDPKVDEQGYFDKKTSHSGQTTGWKGATTNYRKIGEAGVGLECDPFFMGFMQKPVFRSICSKMYGPHRPIGVYRAMVFNKPAAEVGGGSMLPWHQDGGEWWALDRDPLVFCWTALYPATQNKGCVQAIRGSYKMGILSRQGHMLSDQEAKLHCSDPKKVVHLETKPGETWLVHNWTIHRSGTNKTNEPRMAFSANYIDGATKVLNPKPKEAGKIGEPGQTFAEVFPPTFQSDVLGLSRIESVDY